MLLSNYIVAEANRLKALAGKKLSNQLSLKFDELKQEKIIKDYWKDINFNHSNFIYEKQYLANFVIETLDNQYIVINSSSSFRNDRFKIQSYDIKGILEHSLFANSIIASIMLYPDKEAENSTFKSFKKLLDTKKAYTPATHTLLLSELIEFLENHKALVEEKLAEEEKERVESENLVSEQIAQYDSKELGSYYGLKGNEFEKKVVDSLNNPEMLFGFKSFGNASCSIFNLFFQKVVHDLNLDVKKVRLLEATNTVTKLKNGGNAKTDILVKIKCQNSEYQIAISLKCTTQNKVTCHDYQSIDFKRVLDESGTKLSYYLDLFQEAGSHKDFVNLMQDNDSSEEFEMLLAPHTSKLIEWALTGQHDTENLIAPDVQISEYILINRSGVLKFTKFSEYIEQLNESKAKKTYGTPLSWTYPSKNRGKRIQLKVPVLLD